MLHSSTRRSECTEALSGTRKIYRGISKKNLRANRSESEDIFCYAYHILALEHVDHHVGEVVVVRVERDGVYKNAHGAARHAVRSSVESAFAAQWRRGHHCGVVWPRGILVKKIEVGSFKLGGRERSGYGARG